MVTVDDVRSRCLSLPGVMERLNWKQPARFARTQVLRESYRLAGPLPPTV